MSSKKIGRPRIVDLGGSSKNIYLPCHHIDYVDSLALRDLVSFSAVVRLMVEQHFVANGGKVEELR